MARPRKGKMVCQLPEVNNFGPFGLTDKMKFLTMTVEEYESIRLMDHEGLTQEESAVKMGISRSTFQKIYDDARKKMAKCLVEGYRLVIQGGDYKICHESDGLKPCRHKGCCRRRQLDGQ